MKAIFVSMNIKDLHQIFLESNGVSTDTRRMDTGSLFFALKGTNFDGNLYALEAIEKGASYAVIDDEKFEGLQHCIYVPDVLTTLQKLANYHRHFCKAKIIGITGSNGKTTTKELIYAVLSTTYITHATKGNFNNHIGVPLTLLELNPSIEVAIIEMGANRPLDIKELCVIADPDIGYITNIGEAHLEGLKDLHGVYMAKTELFQFIVNSGERCIVNQFDPYLKDYSPFTKKCQFLNAEISVSQNDSPYLVIKYQESKINSQLTGAYNIDNVRAAITIGTYLGVISSNIKTGIESYTPTNQRSQILDKDDYTVILDAYNANPTSMRKSLENAKKNVHHRNRYIAFIGDMLELGNYSDIRHQEIIRYALDLGYDDVILIGDHFAKAYKALKDDLGALGEDESNRIRHFDHVNTAKLFYAQLHKKHSCILLKASRAIRLEQLLDYDI